MILIPDNESEGFLIYAFNKSISLNDKESSDEIIHEFMKKYILDTDSKLESYLEPEIEDDHLREG